MLCLREKPALHFLKQRMKLLEIVRNQLGLFNGHRATDQIGGVAGDLLQTFKEPSDGVAEIGIARQKNILDLGCG